MTAIHYGLDPIAPTRLYDQPEPKLKLTPRMAAAVIAVSLVYVGGGMALNMVGIEFVIPPMNEAPVMVVERWVPPAPEVPVERPVPITHLEPLKSTPMPPIFADRTPLDTDTKPTEPVDTPTIGTTETPVFETKAPPLPPTFPPAPTISNPSWMQKPTADQLGRLYPRRAAARGIGGSAMLDCRVTATGTVNSCVVLREAPAGYGFGEAALASARYFKLNPRTVDGQAIEGAKVQIPMGFNLTE